MARSARTCAVDGCDKPRFSRGWCSAHYTRWRRHGDPLAWRRQSDRHGMWRGDKVGYHGAHRRLRSLRGPAASHTCAICQRVSARQWAYDRTDADERQSSHGPYSLDPGRYHPLCAGCHKLYDVAALAATGWTVWNKGPEVCSVNGCEEKAHARGWCRMHYNRWYRESKS